MSRHNSSIRGAFALAAVLVVIACRTDPDVAKKQYLDNGNRFFDDKKYAEAIVEYRNALKVDPMFGEARLKLAEAFSATQNVRGAFGEYIRAADLLPDNVDAQLKAGTMLLLSGQFEEAQTRAEKVLSMTPDHVPAQVLKANALAGLKDMDGAVREIEEALQLDPQSGIYSNLGALQLARGQSAQAEEAFKRAVDIDPTSISARLGLANFYWQAGKRTEAEDAFKAALAINPDDELANRALATFYVAIGEPSRSEAHLRRLVDLGKDSAPRLLLADYYLAMKRPAEAVALLEQAATEEAFFVPAKARLGAIQFSEGRREEAHKTIDDTLAKSPTDVTALMMKARFLLAENRLPEALVRAKAAVEADQRSAVAHHLLGSIHAASNDLDAAVTAFNEVLKLNPKAVSAQLALSRIELRQGHADVSVQLAQEALATAPGHAPARLFLARGLLMRGDIALAENEARRLLQQFPDAAPVHALMGAILLARKELPAARRYFDKAASLDERSLEALAGLVAVDMTEKKAGAARGRVEAMLAKMPANPSLVLLAARTYVADNDVAKAEEVLRRAIDTDASNYAAYDMLGRIYVRQKRMDDALREFETLTTRQPDSVPAHTMTAMIYQAQGKTREAKERYERIMQIDSKAAVAANNLAWLYAEEDGNLDLALQLAQTAKQQLPEQPEVSDTLGYIYLKKELPALAIPAFQDSIDKDPNNAVYHFRLGMAFAKVGDNIAAKKALERALQLRPDLAEAGQARQLLANIS